MRILVAILVACCLLISSLSAQTQKEDTSWKHIYRATPTKINDLVHTKLAVHFDYDKSWMYGRAWITLHPHFYPTDSLKLDAKGMTINEVSMSSNGKVTPLHYTYDSMYLRITLNRIYKANENYTVYIDYIAKPNGFKAEHPDMMPGEKGLYFINPHNEVKGKPIQIWTQGETTANSYWVPTIDNPNQKMTDEIAMTVPAKYLTLSNGLLVSQKTNSDGTRTDTWKMSLLHSPYLLFMGVGDYAVIKDSYKGKDVNYYVEKEYAPYARRIFGYTPEMIAFFSRITGVDFPWPKYDQITGRDYIFGAMENTSATLHEENSQQDARQLVDGNGWETTIAHELFHQWFGDYVTTESWSNITLNESFADYSETLWEEYKHGKEAGQEQIYGDLRTYTGNPNNATEDLVRFHYQNAIDAFDAVGYQKGGCILHMLRNYVGDSAFFKAINLYLTTNKFSNAEAQQLRLAFEQVTGQDLNWFFNQWYYNQGHPKLDISYVYDNNAKTATVNVKQTQNGIIFKLPFAIDVYTGGAKKRYTVWMNDSTDTYSFPANTQPDLINVDADKILVCEKTDHKTAENFIYQYNHAGSYVDRRETIAFFLNNHNEPQRITFLQAALKDSNEGLRSMILQRINLDNDTVKNAMRSIIESIATNDPKSLVRADAISDLGSYNDAQYKALFTKAITDSSYTVAGNALVALEKIDSAAALTTAQSLYKQPAKGMLQYALLDVFSRKGSKEDYAYIYNSFEQAGIQARLGMANAFATALGKEKDLNYVKQQVDMLTSFRESLPAFLQQYGNPVVNTALSNIATAVKPRDSVLTNYIFSKLPVEALP
jgi:aminopeptidase N